MIENKVHARQVHLLYAQAIPGFIATVVNASVVALVLYPVTPVLLLVIWLAAVYFITTGRYLLVRSYGKRVNGRQCAPELDYGLWEKYFMLGAVLAGAAWGFVGSILLPVDSLAHQLVVMIAMAGMAAGAVPVLSSVLTIYYAYLIPLLLPLVVWLLVQQTTPHFYSAVMVAMFLAILVSSARRIHANLTESSRLLFENEQLLAETTASAKQLETANRELAHEVAARRRTEQELQVSKEFMEKVMDSTFNAIYAVDRDGRLILVNQATARMLGYAVEELMGVHFTQLVAGSSLARAETLFRRIIGHGVSVHDESMELVNSQGETREIVFTLSPIREGMQITGAVGSAEDITDKNLLQRMRTEFVSTVSHELRTPLTSIHGSLGLICGGAAGELPGQAQELVNIAHDNSDRLLRLINDLLDIQKLESGKLHISLKLVTLVTALEQVRIASAGMAEAHQVELELLVAREHRSIKACIDHDRFVQAVTNLVSNAIKFSPAGEKVSISVTVNESSIQVAVIDRGPGIPPDCRDTIFEKFTQVDGSNTRNESGSGLGLTIARSLMENMNGTLDFDSTPGKGSAFYVSLPVAGA